MAYPIIRRTFIPWILHYIGSVEGIEHVPTHGPFLVVSNHVSFIEPPVIAGAVVSRTKQRVYSLTGEYVWRTFRMLGMANWLGMAPVLAHGERSRILAHAEQRLREGQPVLVFPEGQRNDGPTLLKGKTGAARLALALGCPVIPVGYQGPPGWHTWQSIRNFFAHRRDIHVRFGEAFSFPKTEEVTHELLTATTTTIMQAIAPLCGKAYPFA